MLLLLSAVRRGVSASPACAPCNFFQPRRFAITQRVAMTGGPLQQSMEAKLRATLSPVHLEIINESSLHNTPEGAESHFKVIVVSEAFTSKALIARHRMVNAALADDLEREGGIHALSMTTKTPEQWEASGGKVDPSPKCAGGMKREAEAKAAAEAAAAKADSA